MRRGLCWILCLALLCMPVFAAAEQTPETLLREFLAQHALNESNFALSYYNLATGESCAYNADAFLPVGEAWILPLHMYYDEQEALGVFEPPESAPEEEYTIDGLTLEDCRYRSILRGDAEVSQKMCSALGSLEQYQLLLNESFGHYEEAQLPEEYLSSRCYSATFLMNCLKTLASEPEIFGELLQNFQLSQSDEGFAAGAGYRLVHILGQEDGMLCDLGEISAPQPYLLVCFVSEEAGGKALLAEVCALFSEAAGEPSAPQTSGDVPEHTHGEAVFQIAPSRADDTLFWVLAALGGAAVLAVCLFFALRHRKRK